MASFKPIKVYGKGPSPNPLKVAIVLRQLGLAYEIDPVPYNEVKNEAYTKLNPNGRLPTIHDPNTGITLWESGAIVEYLIEKYDKEHKLSFPAGSEEAHHARQWLYFQVSGQAPYYGQAAWFVKFHPEKLPSAVERYTKEVIRVVGVLDGHLAKQEKGGDGPWLVGGKMSFVDLAFLPWQRMITIFVSNDEYDDSKFPHANAWLAKMCELDSVKAAVEECSDEEKALRKRDEEGTLNH